MLVLGTNNKDNVQWVMISHFLLSCTTILVRSVRQWKLIFFSLRGDITVINFSMEWRKLEDCCNLSSEINLEWYKRSWGNTGHKQVLNDPLPLCSNRRNNHMPRPLCARNATLLALSGIKRSQKWNSLYLSAITLTSRAHTNTHTHDDYRKSN